MTKTTSRSPGAFRRSRLRRPVRRTLRRPRGGGAGDRAATFVAGAVAAAFLLAATAGVAHAEGAKLLDLHAAILAGGSTGGGNAGTGTATVPGDFFHQTQGPGFGAEVGMRLLVVDLSIRFLQMVGSKGREGTQSSIMFGPSIEIPVQGGGTDIHGKPRPVLVVVRPSVTGGFVFGTPAPVNPPLSDDQISAKGLLVMGRFAVERMFGPIVGLGGEVDGGYHYLLGGGGTINGQGHSEGWQLAAFGTFAVHFGI